ncbi:SdiA-regulated domain-containing protein [Pseudomonas sp. NPDC089569]|uniref:SdiA-regulated domain-containing protein n=1 Tax=Pseudomonas sp. NPDC089569 TaxID=3390722 RepID=UPI003CFC09F4
MARNAGLFVVFIASALVFARGARTDGHPALLSDVSANITELEAKGRFVSSRSLCSQACDLKNTVPQAEGMTRDRDGELDVVGGPNPFYRFSKSIKASVASLETS